MNIKTQELRIIEQLEKTFKVSRNWALQNYISRLGAHIKNLVNSGYQFEDTPSESGKSTKHGRFIKTKNGEDYVYFLKSAPKR
jgi:hypothetical protein